MKNKKVLLFVIGALLLTAVGISISYAYYIATVSQQGENVVKTDCFALTYEDEGAITLSNTFPVKDSEVSSVSPYHFKIKNVCDLPASYQVNLEILNESNVDIQYLNTKLDNGAITSLSSLASETPTLTGQASSAKLIATGNLLANEEKEYDLRVWLKESATTNDPVQNKTFKSKVVVIATLNKAIIKNIVLHPNGGTIENETLNGYVGYKYENLPTPTKEGENFLGWYTDSLFTNKVTNDSIIASEVTDLYAKYEPIACDLLTETCDLNTVGSIVKIANEEFYVIGQEDSTHVKLLSKWNLNVGPNAKGTATGLQESDVRGWRKDGGTSYGAVAFSNTNYWLDGSALKPAYGSSYPAYVYDSNSNTKQYVDDYVTYLTNQGVNVSGRLIKQEELVSLGCPASTLYCDSRFGGTAPAWVYQTSYWSGSAYNRDGVWNMYSSGSFSIILYDRVDNYGVRPVIILEK